MGVAALGPLGKGLRVASGAPGDHTRLVVVNLFGGNDGLNTVVPSTLQTYVDRRPTIHLDAASTLPLTGGPGTSLYRLHAALPNLRALWDEGSVAIVNKVGYPDANLSHFTSQDIYSYGVRDSFAPLGLQPSGWLARFADLYAPTPMGAVAVGVGQMLDLVGGTSHPLSVANLSGFRYATDGKYPNNHLHRLEAAKEILAGFSGTGLTGDVKEALGQGYELADQVQAALTAYGAGTVTYPTGAPGAYLRDVAVLIEGGFETRVFYTGQGGYDTHGAQGAGTGTHATLLGRLDAAIGAFAADMKARGVWDRIAILVVSEFGRRNDENGSNGTDHAHPNVFLVVGGAVRGGTYGDDLTEADLAGNYPEYQVDFRDLYKDLLRDHLGVDPLPVFPEPQDKNVVLGLVA
jgi:uncharacterized protein (DUF1501 family)